MRGPGGMNPTETATQNSPALPARLILFGFPDKVSKSSAIFALGPANEYFEIRIPLNSGTITNLPSLLTAGPPAPFRPLSKTDTCLLTGL